MDPTRFDALARTLASRRAAARGLAAIAAVGALGGGLAAAPVAAKKKKKPRGFGCTIEDSCNNRRTVPCPDAPGGHCYQHQGKPVCAALDACSTCTKDKECVQQLGKGARCIKDCVRCELGGMSSVCILPQKNAKG